MRKFMVLAAVLGVMLAPGVAQAGYLATYPGVSDCAGEFGGSFGACKIPAEWDPDQSPVIAKYDGAWQLNVALFPSLDGTEWTFDPTDPMGSTSGMWYYNPGPGDPVISFFVAKAAGGGASGGGFNLYSVDGDGLSGAWDTSVGLDGKGLSHVTFYDTTGDGDGGGDGGGAPEPGMLVMLGAGLVGLAAKLRRS